MVIREWEGAFRWGNKLKLPVLTSAPTGRTQVKLVNHHLILHFSSPVSLMFFSLSFHLLITLCTQLTQIKEQLQSRSRKLELKGCSLLSASPSFLISRHLSSNSSGEPNAERGDVCLSQVVPSSPFLLLYLAKTVLSRVLGPGITEKPLGSEERTVPEKRTNMIRITKQVGI